MVRAGKQQDGESLGWRERQKPEYESTVLNPRLLGKFKEARITQIPVRYL